MNNSSAGSLNVTLVTARQMLSVVGMSFVDEGDQPPEVISYILLARRAVRASLQSNEGRLSHLTLNLTLSLTLSSVSPSSHIGAVQLRWLTS